MDILFVIILIPIFFIATIVWYCLSFELNSPIMTWFTLFPLVLFISVITWFYCSTPYQEQRTYPLEKIIEDTTITINGVSKIDHNEYYGITIDNMHINLMNLIDRINVDTTHYDVVVTFHEGESSGIYWHGNATYQITEKQTVEK